MKLRNLLAVFWLVGLSAHAQSTGSAKQECETLLDAVLPFAEQMLQKHGEFFPYGGAIKSTGEIINAAGWDGRDLPPSVDVIKLLKQEFIQGAKSGKYKATALVYDVRVVLPTTGKKSDAVAVSLNHRDNYSVLVMRPYTIQEGTVKFGDAFAQKGEADVFTSK